MSPAENTKRHQHLPSQLQNDQHSHRSLLCRMNKQKKRPDCGLPAVMMGQRILKGVGLLMLAAWLYRETEQSLFLHHVFLSNFLGHIICTDSLFASSGWSWVSPNHSRPCGPGLCYIPRDPYKRWRQSVFRYEICSASSVRST
jgi:hypothetical protein